MLARAVLRVMAGLVPAISIGKGVAFTDWDGRHKRGHDQQERCAQIPIPRQRSML
jgi:hypothetical protein